MTPAYFRQRDPGRAGMTRSAWGLDSEPALDWSSEAACDPKTADWFWLDDSEPGHWGGLSANNRQALRVCASCPVLRQCYDFELAAGDETPRIAAGVRWSAGLPIHLSPCGTNAAAKRHRVHKEPLDPACVEAERQERRRRWAARSKVENEVAA